MSLLLIVVTAISLAIAAGAVLLAWRLAREERRRSEARVRLLAAGIHDDPAEPVTAPPMFDVEGPVRLPAGSLAPAVGAAAALALCVWLAFAAPAPAGAPASPGSSPIVLIALEHREEGGTLFIRGAVEWPGSDPPGAPVTAVASVMDGRGGILATAASPLQPAGGVESTFSIALPGLNDPRRYRVGFRRDNRTIAHVDRRERPSPAQEP